MALAGLDNENMEELIPVDIQQKQRASLLARMSTLKASIIQKRQSGKIPNFDISDDEEYDSEGSSLRSVGSNKTPFLNPDGTTKKSLKKMSSAAKKRYKMLKEAKTGSKNKHASAQLEGFSSRIDKIDQELKKLQQKAP